MNKNEYHIIVLLGFKPMSSIFLFHRDLRLDDNNGLIKMLGMYSDVIPLFILTPEQITNNKYKSDASIQFMVESLKDLDRQLGQYGSKLHIIYGDTLDGLNYYKSFYNVKAVGFNRDYTPYSKQRDLKIWEWGKSNGVEVVMSEDYTTLPINEVVTKGGGFYKGFTYFYKNHIERQVPDPVLFRLGSNLSKLPPIDGFQVGYDKLDSIYKPNSHIYIRGGRYNCLSQLENIKSIDYDKIKDKPMNNTTLLSPHIKFGTVSIREVYHKGIEVFGKDSEFVRQIIWHDFYASLMNGLAVNDTLGGGNYKHMIIKWDNNPEWFKAWMEGRTGFPLVDAGMRQMNQTGWMHNQARMIVANFLTVILNIDWRWGEQYFATRLIDYDPASNNGNWQWSVQVGIDRPRVYPRIYNPWSYAKRKDPQATYIKQWVPELANVPPNDIHTWEKSYSKHKPNYPQPIVNFDQKKAEAEERYRNAVTY